MEALRQSSLARNKTVSRRGGENIFQGHKTRFTLRPCVSCSTSSLPVKKVRLRGLLLLASSHVLLKVLSFVWVQRWKWSSDSEKCCFFLRCSAVIKSMSRKLYVCTCIAVISARKVCAIGLSGGGGRKLIVFRLRARDFGGTEEFIFLALPNESYGLFELMLGPIAQWCAWKRGSASQVTWTHFSGQEFVSSFGVLVFLLHCCSLKRTSWSVQSQIHASFARGFHPKLRFSHLASWGLVLIIRALAYFGGKMLATWPIMGNVDILSFDFFFFFSLFSCWFGKSRGLLLRLQSYRCRCQNPPSPLSVAQDTGGGGISHRHN